MGLDWKLSVKSEVGEYIDVQTWESFGSRYYGPYKDSRDGWYDVGDWPSIHNMILNTMSEYKSPLYYWSDHHDEPMLVTPELLSDITKHYFKQTRKAGEG